MIKAQYHPPTIHFCCRNMHKTSSFSPLTLEQKLSTLDFVADLSQFAAVKISVHLHASSHDPLL